MKRDMLRQKLLTIPTAIVLTLIICAILAVGFLVSIPAGTRVTANPDGTRVTNTSPAGTRVTFNPNGIRVN